MSGFYLSGVWFSGSAIGKAPACGHVAMPVDGSMYITSIDTQFQ
jgi:hypothetical protein